MKNEITESSLRAAVCSAAAVLMTILFSVRAFAMTEGGSKISEKVPAP